MDALSCQFGLPLTVAATACNLLADTQQLQVVQIIVHKLHVMLLGVLDFIWGEVQIDACTLPNLFT